jgi:peptidoglycan-N-acetylglucosamine deacetylase
MRHRHAIVIAAVFGLACGGVAAASSLTGSQAPPPRERAADPPPPSAPLTVSPHAAAAVLLRSRTVALASVVRRVEGAGRRVALTFDDGDPVWWRRALRVLRARRVKATFFILGPYVGRAPGLARRTLAEGHAIGSHGWTHAIMTTETAARARVELVRSKGSWWAAARATPTPFLRPPYGMFDRETRRVAARAGFTRLILWDVDPEDWREPGARVIARRVLSKVRPGSIVLLHLKRQTVRALPAILRGLRRRGLTPVTVPVLLRAATA